MSGRLDEERIVSQLADAMRGKLLENCYKPSWQEAKAETLLGLLISEVMELQGAVESGSVSDVYRECADVANYAAMIVDNAMRGGGGRK